MTRAANLRRCSCQGHAVVHRPVGGSASSPQPRRYRPAHRLNLACRISGRIKAGSEEYEGPLLERLDSSSEGGLGGTSEEVFGPLAVALVGFSLPEFKRIKSMLTEMEAGFIEVIPIGASSINLPLSQVINSKNSNFEEAPLGLRRTIFLSGMYASEVQEIIGAYHESGLSPAVFAAFIPKNKDKLIVDLVDEVYDDHEYMIRQRNENS